MVLKLTNNATSTLAGSIAAGDTAIAIASGDAGKFPTLGAGDWFPMTIVDASGNLEIVKVTGRTGGTLTVARGQEGTAARAFAAGSRADLRLTSAALAAFASTDSVAALSTTVGNKADQTALDAVSNAVGQRLPLGGGTMTGDIDMGGKKIKNLASLNGGPLLAGLRNRLINPNMKIAQRAISQSTAGIGSIDRWYLGLGAGTLATLTQGKMNPGGLGFGITEDTNYAQVIVSNYGDSSNGYCYLEQRIEGVGTLNGKKATGTVWVFSTIATGIFLEYYQYYGSGGSPSTTTWGGGLVVNVQANIWTRIDVPVDMPSIVGKTLGTNGDDSLIWRLWFSSPNNVGNHTGTFLVAHASMVEGDARNEADPSSPRPDALELMLCQRYYERTPRWTTQQFKNASNNMYDHDKWQVRKRVVPTIAAIFWNNVNCGVPTFVPTVDGVIMYATKDGTNGEASVQWEIAAGAELS